MNVGLIGVALACAGMFGCAGAQRTASGDLTELLAKHLAARGGPERVHAWTTAHLAGTLFLGPQKVPLIVDIASAGLVREEARFTQGNFVRTFDGHEGWEVNPFVPAKEPRKLTEDELKDRRAVADFNGPLVDAEQKHITLERLADDVIDGHPVAHLRSTRPDGRSEDDFVDLTTFQLVRVQQKLGDGSLNEANYKDFRCVDKLPCSAFVIESGLPGQGAQQRIVFDEMVANDGTTAERFKKP
ncbi:MAG: hypothetical protein JST92_06775 [Deltaproteobacteria bacterium]|nr:hypothetical protein [Deltaproteobacteria bacterium]